LTRAAVSALPSDPMHNITAFQYTHGSTSSITESSSNVPNSPTSVYRGMARSPIDDPRKLFRDTKEVVTRWRLSSRATRRIDDGTAPLFLLGHYVKVRGHYEVTTRSLPGVLDINRKYRQMKLIALAHVEPDIWCCRITTHGTAHVNTSLSILNNRLSSKRIVARNRPEVVKASPLRVTGLTWTISPPDPTRFWSVEEYLAAATRRGWKEDPGGVTVGPLPGGHWVTMTHPSISAEPMPAYMLAD
jgi:hypothetical protein